MVLDEIAQHEEVQIQQRLGFFPLGSLRDRGLACGRRGETVQRGVQIGVVEPQTQKVNAGLDRFIAYANAHPNVWFAGRVEVARTWLDQFPPER